MASEISAADAASFVNGRQGIAGTFYLGKFYDLIYQDIMSPKPFRYVLFSPEEFMPKFNDEFFIDTLRKQGYKLTWDKNTSLYIISY